MLASKRLWLVVKISVSWSSSTAPVVWCADIVTVLLWTHTFWTMWGPCGVGHSRARLPLSIKVMPLLLALTTLYAISMSLVPPDDWISMPASHAHPLCLRPFPEISLCSMMAS